MKGNYATHLFSKTDSKHKWVWKSTKLASMKEFRRVFLRCHWWLLPFKFQNPTTVRYCCRLRASLQPSSFPSITLQPKLGSPPMPTLGIVPARWESILQYHQNLLHVFNTACKALSGHVHPLAAAALNKFTHRCHRSLADVEGCCHKCWNVWAECTRKNHNCRYGCDDHLMVLSVRMRIQCGTGRFCFIFFANLILILKVLWDGCRITNLHRWHSSSENRKEAKHGQNCCDCWHYTICKRYNILYVPYTQQLGTGYVYDTHMHIILQISQKTVKIKDLFPLCMRTHQSVITLA